MNRVVLMIVSALICGLMSTSCGSKQEIIRDENGNIIAKCELKNGVRHGKCYFYFPNGNIWMTCNLINGVINGESIEYFENGSMKVKSNFVNGQAIRSEFYDENGRLEQIDFFKIINKQPRLNGIIVYDVENACNFPYNVNLQETMYAEIFADSDTVVYGSFVEYEVKWMCSEEHWVGAIKNNSTFFIDYNFNQSGSSTFASKDVDLDNKNKFYPSNKTTDTLRVIFGFSRVEEGNVIEDLETYLEKVFTVIEK